MKHCDTCKQEKPVAAFKTRYATCKECRRPREKAYREAHQERMREYHRRYYAKTADVQRTKAREWYQANRSRAAETSRRRRNAKHVEIRARARDVLYGLGPGEYEAMLARQGGVCAICRKAKVLTVDHDHQTSQVRGLLCRSCNSAVGHLGDDIAGLETALAYLRRRKAAGELLEAMA